MEQAGQQCHLVSSGRKTISLIFSLNLILITLKVVNAGVWIGLHISAKSRREPNSVVVEPNPNPKSILYFVSKYVKNLMLDSGRNVF